MLGVLEGAEMDEMEESGDAHEEELEAPEAPPREAMRASTLGFKAYSRSSDRWNANVREFVLLNMPLANCLPSRRSLPSIARAM